MCVADRGNFLAEPTAAVAPQTEGDLRFFEYFRRPSKTVRFVDETAAVAAADAIEEEHPSPCAMCGEMIYPSLMAGHYQKCIDEASRKQQQQLQFQQELEEEEQIRVAISRSLEETTTTVPRHRGTVVQERRLSLVRSIQQLIRDGNLIKSASLIWDNYSVLEIECVNRMVVAWNEGLSLKKVGSAEYVDAKLAYDSGQNRHYTPTGSRHPGGFDGDDDDDDLIMLDDDGGDCRSWNGFDEQEGDDDLVEDMYPAD